MSAENMSAAIALFRCYLDMSCADTESSTQRCAKLSKVITIPVYKPLSEITLHEWYDSWLPCYISRECGLETTSFSIQTMYIPHPQHNCDSLATTTITTNTTTAKEELAMPKSRINGLLYLPSEMTETNQKWYVKLDVNDHNSKNTVMANVLSNGNHDLHSLPTSKLPMYEIVVEVVVNFATCTKGQKELLAETKINDCSNIENIDDCNKEDSVCTNRVLLDITELLQAERHARDELVDLQTCEFTLIIDSHLDELHKIETLHTLQGNSMENGQLASFLRKSHRYPFDTIPLYLSEHERQLRRNDYITLVEQAQTTAALSCVFDKFVDKQCRHSKDNENNNSNSNDDNNVKSVSLSFRAALQHAIEVERQATQRAADELARVQYYTDADLPVPPRPETPPKPREFTMEDIPDDVYDNAIESFLHGRREIVKDERVAYRELTTLMLRVLQRQREADAHTVTCAALSELEAAASVFQLDTYMTNKEPFVSIHHSLKNSCNSGSGHAKETDDDGSKDDQIPAEYKINVSWQVDEDKKAKMKANNNIAKINNNNNNICIVKQDSTTSVNKEVIPIPAKHIGQVQQIQNIMYTLRARATVTWEARMERQVMLHNETKQRQQIIDEEVQHYAQINAQSQKEWQQYANM